MRERRNAAMFSVWLLLGDVVATVFAVVDLFDDYKMHSEKVEKGQALPENYRTPYTFLVFVTVGSIFMVLDIYLMITLCLEDQLLLLLWVWTAPLRALAIIGFSIFNIIVSKAAMNIVTSAVFILLAVFLLYCATMESRYYAHLRKHGPVGQRNRERFQRACKRREKRRERRRERRRVKQGTDGTREGAAQSDTSASSVSSARTLPQTSTTQPTRPPLPPTPPPPKPWSQRAGPQSKPPPR